MVMNPFPESTLQKLRMLLSQMDSAARDLEEISQQELDAIRTLDGDAVLRLTDQRIIAHNLLGSLEKECRQMMSKEGVADDLTLEVIIDMHAGSHSNEFQSLRRKLYERVSRVENRSAENRMRMIAAYNVSSNLLQQLGLTQKEQTYGRRNAG